MAKQYEKPAPKAVQRPAAPSWQRSPGTYIAGQAMLDEMDGVAIEMERKWGAGRLRMLVDVDLRERFDRQRYLVNHAIHHGDLEQVRLQAQRMIKAWQAADRVATEAAQPRLASGVWEIALTNGRVLALARSATEAATYDAGGRDVELWTLEEVARMVEGGYFIQSIKRSFPGAVVVAVRSSLDDPLLKLPDSRAGLTDNLDDDIPF
jgi:hypothetical protein